MVVPVYHRLLLFSLLALTRATPSPARGLAPRACTTANVKTISRLDKATPDDPFNTSLFSLRRTGCPRSNIINSVVSFIDIPQGATGCMLQIDLPRLPTQSVPTPIASGSSQADVWLVKNPAQSKPSEIEYIYRYTWNKPPVKDQLVATTIFPTGPATEPFKTYLWSGMCKEVMSFQLELSEWQQDAGEVRFYNSFGGKDTGIGFQLVYNC